ncbi:MAG: hypothetical protein HXY34_08795 [Candidatus Thorarchaeota archaeon]|nr:hypothetical protein [Candidatus Thorarchaeota archaeon]
MSVMLFLIATLLIHCIPIPPSARMLNMRVLARWLPVRLVWGTVAWLIICPLLMMTLPWAIISLVMSFALLMVISSGLRPSQGIEEFMERIRGPTVCIGVLILIVMPIASGLISWTSSVANANEFDNTLVSLEDGPLFQNPIPDNQVRLVTDTLATFQARKYMSQIGSSVDISAAHITVRNGRLVWVCVVVSTNVLSENYVQGLIVVDANDPDVVEVISGLQFPVGEGLWWDRNIQFGSYLDDMTNFYEYAYPTWDPADNLVYIQTRTQLGLDFVERPLGPKVYCANGTVIAYPTLAETPQWITQAYSEEYLERQISRWGGYRRDDGFDLFAGGFLWFIQPSRNRVAMTEDTRYILNPDTNRVEAFVALHPPDATTLTLSGLVRATKDAVRYYDMTNESLVSGEAAVNTIIKDFPKPVTGSYSGAMPLLYPVMVNSTYARQVWYCPVYWYNSQYDSDLEDYVVTDFKLYALGMVDAKQLEISYTVTKGSLTGEGLVQQARQGFVNTARVALGLEPEPEDTIELSATALNVTSYVESGNTHVVLRTSNSTYTWIEGAREWMPLADWYELLTVKEGDSFTATIEQIGSQYRIVAFSKS